VKFEIRNSKLETTSKIEIRRPRINAFIGRRELATAVLEFAFRICFEFLTPNFELP
jgi:hypothetical protein